MSYLNENELKQYLLSLPKKCCFKCKFWIADELPTFSENGKKHIPNDVTSFGDCRKHAPSLLQAESTNEYDAFIFPPTPGREWCGDFKKTIKFICR